MSAQEPLSAAASPEATRELGKEAQELLEGSTHANDAKEQVRQTTSKAIREGRLEREPCEVCGRADPVEAHHDDYEQPLRVRWLCPIHHAMHHVELGDYPRGLSLRDVRHRWGLSIKDVEALTGIHRGNLSRIERGLSIPSLTQLHALSDVYGVLPKQWHVICEFRLRKEFAT